jgi:hypothetical protein
MKKITASMAALLCAGLLKAQVAVNVRIGAPVYYPFPRVVALPPPPIRILPQPVAVIERPPIAVATPAPVVVVPYRAPVVAVCPPVYVRRPRKVVVYR